jgi:paraquat-inducible protein A
MSPTSTSTGVATAMLHHQSLLACHECDALLQGVDARPGQKLICPRCGCTLYKPHRDTINRGLALSLTALILFVPANFLPIMTFNMLGQNNADTMVKGATQLYQQGYWWMSALVFFCSVVAPLLEFVLITGICLLVKLNRYNALMVFMLKIQSHVNRWGMLEVFMLGILVAYIKMIDLGEIEIGIGMLCFSGLLMVTTLNAVLFDTHAIWEKVGQARARYSHG